MKISSSFLLLVLVSTLIKRMTIEFHGAKAAKPPGRNFFRRATRRAKLLGAELKDWSHEQNVLIRRHLKEAWGLEVFFFWGSFFCWEIIYYVLQKEFCLSICFGSISYKPSVVWGQYVSFLGSSWCAGF